MWGQFLRFRALDPEAQKLFLRAAALLLLVGISLHTRGYKKTQDWLQKRLRKQKVSKPTVGLDLDLLGVTCRMVRAAEHHALIRSTCLEESLTLWYLLGQQNIATRVRIGVRKQTEKFEAHAWVEHGGKALMQSEEMHRHFAPFEGGSPSLPAEKL